MFFLVLDINYYQEKEIPVKPNNKIILNTEGTDVSLNKVLKSYHIKIGKLANALFGFERSKRDLQGMISFI